MQIWYYLDCYFINPKIQVKYKHINLLFTISSRLEAVLRIKYTSKSNFYDWTFSASENCIRNSKRTYIGYFYIQVTPYCE